MINSLKFVFIYNPNGRLNCLIVDSVWVCTLSIPVLSFNFKSAPNIVMSMGVSLIWAISVVNASSPPLKNAAFFSGGICVVYYFVDNDIAVER